MTDIESQIKHANQTIKNAKVTQAAAQRIFFQKYDQTSEQGSLQDLVKLAKTMDDVAKTTNTAMKGARLAESRARSRLVAVKKAAHETIRHTAKAKHAAIASKKAAQAAAITSKKLRQNSGNSKKLRVTYRIQVKAALSAAKESEKNTHLALKASKIARAAARIPLKPLQF